MLTSPKPTFEELRAVQEVEVDRSGKPRSAGGLARPDEAGDRAAWALAAWMASPAAPARRSLPDGPVRQARAVGRDRPERSASQAGEAWPPAPQRAGGRVPRGREGVRGFPAALAGLEGAPALPAAAGGEVCLASAAGGEAGAVRLGQ